MAVETRKLVIGDLRPEHWPEVARIYAEGIATGNATFETEVPDSEQWDARTSRSTGSSRCRTASSWAGPRSPRSPTAARTEASSR